MIAGRAQPATPGQPPARRRILGVRVDDVGWDEVLARLSAFVDERQMGGPPRRVVTANPEMIVLARRDPALFDALESADLVTADGVGVRWAGARLGQPIRELVPGSELVGRLAEHLASARATVRDVARAELPDALAGRRWFLLGAAEGVAQQAAIALQRQSPGLRIVGTHAGTPGAEDEAGIRARLAAAGPIDVLLVAYGTPAQELWLARNLPHLDVAVGIGVGGTFDFLAGRVPWPPEWARRMGLIWGWRLARQPWRWRRQLALAEFAFRALGSRDILPRNGLVAIQGGVDVGSVNWNKVLIAGLIAGVAMNAVDIVANGFLWADAWAEAMGALGIDYEASGMASAVTWIVIDLLLGVLIAWLYASMTARYGVGTRTGLLAGAVVWVTSALMFVGVSGMGILPMAMVLRVLVSGAVAAAVAGYVAARFYKEA